jgi:hypothetical protein
MRLGIVVHILALRRWRQEDHELETSLGYITRLCLKHPPPPLIEQ